MKNETMLRLICLLAFASGVMAGAGIVCQLADAGIVYNLKGGPR